jgi:hypothetical protein
MGCRDGATRRNTRTLRWMVVLTTRCRLRPQIHCLARFRRLSHHLFRLRRLSHRLQQIFQIFEGCLVVHFANRRPCANEGGQETGRLLLFYPISTHRIAV